MERSITELEPKDWAEMKLGTRLWNYIKLVEYVDQLQHKRNFVYDIVDPVALRHIVDILEKGEVGILILGEVGSGKTFLMQMLQKVMLPLDRFRTFNTVDVITDFKSNGEETLLKYVGSKVFFDDLGFEMKGTHFGDKVDCMDYLTYKRYEDFSRSGTLSFFATNLDGDQMKNRYDKRTIDRIQGMCHTIVLKGSSKRKTRYAGIIMPHIFPIMYGMPKPNPPKFTIGPTENTSLGRGLKQKFSDWWPEEEAYKEADKNTVKISEVTPENKNESI